MARKQICCMIEEEILEEIKGRGIEASLSTQINSLLKLGLNCLGRTNFKQTLEVALSLYNMENPNDPLNIS